LLPTSWLRRRRPGRLEWSVGGRRVVLGAARTRPAPDAFNEAIWPQEAHRTLRIKLSEPRATTLAMPQDWFTSLTGFAEEGYELTRSRLIVEGDELVSTVNGKRYGIGTLSMPTLAEPRNRVEVCPQQRSTVRCVTNEARAMHADPPLEGALVQVASQFNL
jgi:hypothetical protein